MVDEGRDTPIGVELTILLGLVLLLGKVENDFTIAEYQYASNLASKSILLVRKTKLRES